MADSLENADGRRIVWVREEPKTDPESNTKAQETKQVSRFERELLGTGLRTYKPGVGWQDGM